MEPGGDGAQLLPDELWLEVFSFLHPRQAGGVMRACRRFYGIFATSTLWRRYHEALLGGPLQPVGPDPSSSSYFNSDGEGENDDFDQSENDIEDEDDDLRERRREERIIDAVSFPRFARDEWRQALLWKTHKVEHQRSDEAKLVWAARLGCHQLVARLLDDMLDRHASLRRERSALTSSLPEDEDSEEGQLLRMLCRGLEAACWANSVPTARVLLAYGAAPVQCGYLGVKREAIVEAAEHGNVELVELLIANGALSERWSFANFLPGRPLLAACWAGKTEAVECLMRHEVMCVASKNEFIERWGVSVDLEGVSPLCMAARRGHLNVVSLLLSRLQDELNESEKQNALLSAAKESRNDVIVHLLEHGGVTGDIASLCAYIKSKSFDYATFEILFAGVDDESLGAANVCWSIFKSKRIVGGPDGKKVCELLLAKGADINCTSTTAVLTPLAHAVVKDNVEVAETLLQCGADPNWSALGEANLLCIAQKLHRHRMVDLLSKFVRHPSP